MNSARITWCGVLTVLLIGECSVSQAAELPSAAKVLDPDCIFYLWPYPTISPDGNWIAYVSKGNVCVCNVKSPAPRQIMEVPNSWTWPHFKVRKGNSTSTGSFGEFRGLSRDEYRELHSQVTNTVYGVIWTHDSAGFVFGVQSYDATRKASTYDGYFASVDGDTTRLVHVAPDALTRAMSTGVLTRDRTYLVSTDSVAAAHPSYRPLIWDVKLNKPRATCFHYLIPSKTSGRWIGFEKDTHQLVIVNEQFEVIKRFNEWIPDRSFGVHLDWSPNERFIIWRNRIGFDHFSNWEGFRMDLETGAKRKIDGRFMDEQFGFTGRGGEFYRCGQTGAKTNWYDAIVGAHLTIVPVDDGPPTDLWRLTVDLNEPKPGMLTNRPGNPPLRMSSNGELFAIGLPRPAGERSGCTWHLINRDGRIWRFPGEDNGEYVSPYELAGFADNGDVLVAYDNTRLFAFPISSVMNDANEVKQ